MPQNCRVIVGLVITLGLTIAWTSAALSQNGNQSPARNQQTEPKPETLKSISAAIPPKTPTIYTVKFENFDKYQGRIEVTSDGTWRVIKFNELPSQVSLAIAEKSPVYPIDGQQILPQQWYPFKNAFPFIVSFEKTVALPFEISYELSTVIMPPKGLPAKDAKVYVRDPVNVAAPQFAALKIRFEGVTPPASASLSASPGATSSPVITTPATSEDQLIPGLSNRVVFAIVGSLVLFFVFVAASTKIISAFKKLRRESTKETENRRPPKQGHGKKAPSSYYDLEEIRRDMVVHRPEQRRLLGFIPWGSRKKAGKQEENTWDGVEGTPPTKPTPPAANEAPKSDIDAKPSTRPTGAAPPRPETQRPTDSLPPGSRDPRPLDRETRDRLERIEESHGNLQRAHMSLADRLQGALDPEKGLGHDAEIKVNALRKELKDYFKEESGVLVEGLDEQQKQINKAEKSVQNALTYMQSQVKYFEERVERLLADAKQKETEQHNRYSKLLGEVLGFNVETLKQGEFDAIVNEAGVRLNQYLSEQPAKVDGLSELHRKAQAITGEVQTTLEKVRELKPELEKLEQYGERAKRLASDLKNVSSLQGQPQNLTVTLDLPVGKSTEGRANFLENLGKAIKDQIDRLHDPHAFWSKELEDFATSDIVALADICDVEVTGGRPGSNPELERSLCELFRQAGLKTIVPSVGDPFKPGEQHLIEMVLGSPANSQTIQRVVKRGFYYTGNAKEQLIRKAGVNVYR